MASKRVVLVDVHHGLPAQGRAHIIYASLLDAETGELLISATLPFVLNAVRDRGHVLVKLPISMQKYAIPCKEEP